MAALNQADRVLIEIFQNETRSLARQNFVVRLKL
jgi:hypothetical protein